MIFDPRQTDRHTNAFRIFCVPFFVYILFSVEGISQLYDP